MVQISDIDALHIELTTKCNARCPMCMRNYRGYTYNSGYPLTELSLADIKKIFPTDFCKQIKAVSFIGNLGDFGVAKDAVEIVHYWLDNSPATITIDTNGSMRTPAWWAQLSNPRVEINFALDGLEDTHNLYRQGTNWQKIIDNATAFIQAGGKAYWKFIPFEHNKHQIAHCEQLSESLGFEGFVLWDQGRNQGPVFTSTGSFSHWLGESQELIPLHDLLDSHVNLDPKQYLSIPEQSEITCWHHLGKLYTSIYIAADSTVYPCCYLGYYPSTMTHAGNNQLKEIVKNNNALDVGLEESIQWFSSVYESWNKDSINNGRLYTCINTCGKCQ